MRKRRKMITERHQTDQDFSAFLRRVHEELNVSGEVLGEDLMDLNQLSKIEGVFRPVSKPMWNCLPGRLGVTPDMYENLLDIGDYEAWECQQEISGNQYCVGV